MSDKGKDKLTSAERINISAPELSSIDSVRNRLKKDGRLFLFYYRGKEKKDGKGATTLWRFVQAAKEKGFPLRQWNTLNPGKDKDFFETKYGIKGDMGVIIYRHGKYLTSVRGIQQDEDAKFKDFNKLLENFKGWEVRLSPKEFRLAKKKADKEKAAQAEAAKKVEPVEQGAECCVIL